MSETALLPVGVGFAVFLGICYLACWSYFIRTFNPRVPNNFLTEMLAIFGIFVVPLGMLVGAWYLFFGPTAGRLERRYREAAQSFDDDQFVNLVDEQIVREQLHSDPWVKDKWNELTREQKVALVRQIRRHLDERLASEMLPDPNNSNLYYANWLALVQFSERDGLSQPAG